MSSVSKTQKYSIIHYIIAKHLAGKMFYCWKKIEFSVGTTEQHGTFQNPLDFHLTLEGFKEAQDIMWRVTFPSALSFALRLVWIFSSAAHPSYSGCTVMNTAVPRACSRSWLSRYHRDSLTVASEIVILSKERLSQYQNMARLKGSKGVVP